MPQDNARQDQPLSDTAMDAYSVRLTPFHARLARRIGVGNLSRGIRLAIEHEISRMTSESDSHWIDESYNRP